MLAIRWILSTPDGIRAVRTRPGHRVDPDTVCGPGHRSWIPPSFRRKAVASDERPPSRKPRSPPVRLAGQQAEKGRAFLRVRVRAEGVDRPGKPPRPVVIAHGARCIDANGPAEDVRHRQIEMVRPGGVGLVEPGVAQGGIQMGRWAGRAIAREASGQATQDQRSPFIYRDKGSMAVIGKARAIAQIGHFRLSGFIAWLIWGGIHIAFLIGFRNRLQVLVSWFGSWLLNSRDARLITGPSELAIKVPRPGEFIATGTSAETSVDRHGIAV